MKFFELYLSNVKEKQRRELKKLMNSRDGNEFSGKPETESSKSAKLSSKIIEVIKAGCGFDILNESTTVSLDGTQNHLCLEMYSGLSLLLLENEKQKLKEDGSYDSMISKSEFLRLTATQSNFGFISAAVKDSLISSILGNQACSFDVRIPRGAWSHIAMVNSVDNKITGYFVSVNH